MPLSDPRIWSTFGLLLDIVGAAFLAFPVFVDPSRLRHEGLITEQTVLDRIKESRSAKVGFALLVTGFVLQLVGTWVK